MNLLDLFSGIGGFSLGLERAGFRTVAFCEIEPFCRAVLKKHWPDIPIYHDVRELTAERLRTDGISVDAICGGFPCQDISVAGAGAGIEGERSGLWSEYARIIGEVRPEVALVENVAALLGRGLGRVLGDLAALGYDAEWHCIPASAVGAPHRRDRIWIVAYARSEQHESDCFANEGAAATELPNVADAARLLQRRKKQRTIGERIGARGQSIALPNAGCARLEGQRSFAGRIGTKLHDARNNRGWEPEPNVGRVANGVPSRVDRLRGLGNAVVPQIPEAIGKAILERIAA